MISPSQRPLTDNTQHSQQTNIQALGEIRTHNRSRRAAVDLRLRPRCHWDRQKVVLHCAITYIILTRVFVLWVIQTTDIVAYQIFEVASTSTAGAKTKATRYSETSTGIYYKTIFHNLYVKNNLAYYYYYYHTGPGMV